MVDFDYLDGVPAPGARPTPRPVETDRAQAAFERGEQLYLRGEFEQAAEALREATRLSPEFFRAHAATIDALLALGRVDWAEARAEALLKKYNRNTDLGTARAHAYLHRSQVRRREGDAEGAEFHYGLAVQFCEIATEATPGSSYAWLRRGEVAAAVRTFASRDEAQAWFRKALECERSWMTETRIGMIWHEWGWYEEAQKWLRDVTAASPGRAPAWCWLGSAYADDGRRDEARTAFRMALASEPGYRQALQGLRRCSPVARAARWVVSLFFET